MQWTKFNVSVLKVAFFPQKLFIHFCSGVGFLWGVERGEIGFHYHDAGKKKCEVVVMHIARQ